MPSEVPTSERRRSWLRCLVALLLLASGAVVAIRLARPTVLIGRNWPQSERVACEGVSHELWDELLRRYVDAVGNVDYAGWKSSSSDMKRLDDYLDQLSRLDTRREATKSQRLAFWINAYNAITVRGILREYPTTSIQNHVARVWGYNIWRDLLLVVDDERHSLGQIEHGILRPLNEPRIHFATSMTRDSQPIAAGVVIAVSR